MSKNGPKYDLSWWNYTKSQRPETPSGAPETTALLFGECGGEIRFLLDEQRIFVNGELCSAKRKKLHAGDIVEIKGIGTYEIVGA